MPAWPGNWRIGSDRLAGADGPADGPGLAAISGAAVRDQLEKFSGAICLLVSSFCRNDNSSMSQDRFRLESTLTATGQTTVPQKIRESLGAGVGTKLIWHVSPGGGVIVRAKTQSVLAMKGVLKSSRQEPVAVEDMNPWR